MELSSFYYEALHVFPLMSLVYEYLKDRNIAPIPTFPFTREKICYIPLL